MFKYSLNGIDFTTTVELDLNWIDNDSLHIVDGDTRYFKPIANFEEKEDRQYSDQSYVIVSDFSSFTTLEELTQINLIMEVIYPDIHNIDLKLK
jgi:hypothetical protein